MLNSYRGDKIEIGDFIAVARNSWINMGWYAGEGNGTIQYWDIPYHPEYFIKHFENRDLSKIKLNELGKSYCNKQLGRAIRINEEIITDEGVKKGMFIIKEILKNNGINTK